MALRVGSWGLGVRRIKFVTPMRALVPITLSIVTLLTACGRRSDPAAVPQQDWFVDRSKETGLNFVHVNGMSGKLYVPEVLAPGVALFDYDNDGDLDVFLVQGGSLRDPGPGLVGIPTRGFEVPGSGGRLFRNDLQSTDGTRTLRFTDVTSQSGIVTARLWHGRRGRGLRQRRLGRPLPHQIRRANQLLRNNGDGTFSDVSKASGTDERSWSVSASFVDVESRRLARSLRRQLPALLAREQHALLRHVRRARLLHAAGYQPLPDRLYHEPRRRHVRGRHASPSGIAREYGPALGVSTADFNGDGWMDVYVANDGKENQLWINQHDGTFENAALLAGVGAALIGKAEASMGVDAGDFDDDGDEDLFVTELTGEGSNLYVNDGTGVFEDRSARVGARCAQPAVHWFRDRLVRLRQRWPARSAVRERRPCRSSRRCGRRTIRCRCTSGNSCSATWAAADSRTCRQRAGAVFQLPEVGRGAAFGDVDNDGDMDVLVGNNNGPARLLINQAANRNHWIGLRWWDGSGRDMLGARVEMSARRRRRSGVGRARTAATPRPTIRESWSDWASLPGSSQTCAYTGRRQDRYMDAGRPLIPTRH